MTGSAGLGGMLRSDRGRRLVIVLTLVTTVLAAVVAGLEVGASTRADDANRESQRLAIVASAELVSAGRAGQFETDRFGEVITAAQDALVHRLSAAERSQDGDASGAAELTARADVADARAARLRELSRLYTDPRWTPENDDGTPRPEGPDAFIADIYAQPQATVERQNAASDAYAVWDGKSAAYVGVLSVLALIFFLLGVGQVNDRSRPVLTLTASGMIVLSVLWTAFITWG